MTVSDQTRRLIDKERLAPPERATVNPAVRRVPVEFGPHSAFCKEDAGTGAAIDCYLDHNGHGAAAYNSGTTYGKGAVVSSGGHAYVSLQADNTGHTPASSPTWWSQVAEVEVACKLSRATNLSDCFPLLQAGEEISVYSHNDTWKSYQTFIGQEACS